jgi:hypothetical protein
MDSFAIQVNGVDAVRGAIGDLGPKAMRAFVRAANRGINAGRTSITRDIAGDTGLKSADVTKALMLKEASYGSPVASLGASLKRLPLIQFNARGPEPSRGKGKGVTARLPGGRGRYPNAFIATMGSGHRGVFQRSGNGRLPVHELFGPSLGHVFSKYEESAVARTLQAFEQNFGHELDFEMGQANA